MIDFFAYTDILTYNSDTNNDINVTKLQTMLDFCNKIDIIDI